jgi:type IV pilus assembly protein PilC
MRVFAYKAWDQKYNIVKGILEEENVEQAKEKLRSKGLKIISVSTYISLKNVEIGRRVLKDAELANFCEQMGILLNSGINILKGLEVLQEQAKNKKLRFVLSGLRTGVQRGKTLASSMEDTKAFPKLLSDMVSSGELSGNVDTIFYNMEKYYEREARLREKVKTASVYPIILLTVAVGMLIFFNFFVFSELKELFSDNQNLPNITKALVRTIEFFNNNFPGIILTAVLLIILLKYISEKAAVKAKIDRFSLFTPLIGSVNRDMITARFTRSLSLFLKSAVPVLRILDSLKLIVDNLYISRKIESVKTLMTNGNSIADAIQAQKVFDPLVVQMIRVGEESGKLEESLNKLADIYDKRVEVGINRLMAMIEPVFTLLVGLFVGVLILAMIMPVMQMTNSFR